MMRGLEERDKKVLENKKRVNDLTPIFESQNKELKGILKRYG